MYRLEKKPYSNLVLLSFIICMYENLLSPFLHVYIVLMCFKYLRLVELLVARLMLFFELFTSFSLSLKFSEVWQHCEQYHQFSQRTKYKISYYTWWYLTFAPFYSNLRYMDLHFTRIYNSAIIYYKLNMILKLFKRRVDAFILHFIIMSLTP